MSTNKRDLATENVNFYCDDCDKDYQLKNLIVNERENEISYTCPVCDEILYETVLNRNRSIDKT